MVGFFSRYKKSTDRSFEVGGDIPNEGQRDKAKLPIITNRHRGIANKGEMNKNVGAWS